MADIEILAAAFIFFVFGICLGALGMRRRWMRNADEEQRMESGGKLFKVLYDEKYQLMLNVMPGTTFEFQDGPSEPEAFYPWPWPGGGTGGTP